MRAERHHVEILVVGVDAEFRRLARVQDRSEPSDVVDITVPAMEDAA